MYQSNRSVKQMKRCRLFYMLHIYIYNYNPISHSFSLSLSLSISLIVFISIVSSAQSDEQCQSLLQVSSGNTQCTPHGNCTGLTCVNIVLGMSVTTSFPVEKCRDPVLVNVIVTANSNTHHLTFNQSTTGTIGSYTFNWIMSRNDSYVQVEVQLNISFINITYMILVT